MSHSVVRIVKVGGSLLDLPDLSERLKAWLQRQAPGHSVLIAGGGALVEQLRRWHAARSLNDQAAHWMAIDLMTVTAHFLHARLGDVFLEEQETNLCQRIGVPGVTIFGTAGWLRYSEPKLRGKKLPWNWQTTSDAIAGRLAAALNADELVLLKSTLPECPSTLEDYAKEGFIDPVLEKMRSELTPVRTVNFLLDKGSHAPRTQSIS